MNDELTIKKERVLAAAAKCSTADGILREIFPEAFEAEWEDITKDCVVKSASELAGPYVFHNGSARYLFTLGPKTEATSGIGFEVKIEFGRIWRRKA